VSAVVRVEERVQGTDRVNVWAHGAKKGGEDVSVKVLEGVGDEGVGPGGVVDWLCLAEPEADVVQVGCADEARDVDEADRWLAGRGTSRRSSSRGSRSSSTSHLDGATIN
jgi:hypothetical protein